uniref:Uncharacterized protein n=1 Tax=Micrurus surinamensis TaxID=129470 RepID=A0A2D4PZF2_MICSU
MFTISYFFKLLIINLLQLHVSKYYQSRMKENIRVQDNVVGSNPSLLSFWTCAGAHLRGTSSGTMYDVLGMVFVWCLLYVAFGCSLECVDGWLSTIKPPINTPQSASREPHTAGTV